MKKKFLSLMMAAAVVATTSVSAFASTKVIESEDNQEAQSDVKITGKIQDQNGNDPVGTFKVTIPTAADFTVNKEGSVITANLDIKNAGSQGIEVYAYRFVDESSTSKINIVKEQEILGNSKNSTVALKLTSSIGNGVAYLSSDSSKGGVYTDKGLSTPAEGLGVKLLTLSNGTEQNPTSGQIRLEGKGGKNPESKAVSDDFKLTLKIKKVDKKVDTQVSGPNQEQGSREDEVAHQ